MGKNIPKYMSPLVSLLYYSIPRMPFRMAFALMGFVMVKGGERFLRPKNFRRNIRDIFPDLDDAAVDALSKKMIANFGYHVAEIFHMVSFREDKKGTRIDYSTPPGTELNTGRPAIYVGAHVGSWEICPVVFNRTNRLVTIVYSENDSSLIDDLLLTQRLETGSKYVEKNKALRRCVQALSRGESVAMLVDQRVEAGVDVNFFGRKTAMTRLPASLALKFNCPIVPMDVSRIEIGHLHATFYEEIVSDDPDAKDAEAALTQKIADAIEASIRRNFEAWFCSKLRWRSVDKEKLRVQEAALGSGRTPSSPSTVDI